MKQEKIDLSQERKILIYMIVSSQFLKEIMPALQSKFFKSSYSRLLSGWIVDHFNEYQEAPGKHIQDIYEARYSSIRNEDELEMVSSFLTSLSSEWKNYQDLGNIGASVGKALVYFKVRSIDLLREQLEISVQKNDPVYGENAVATYGRVEVQKTKAVSILKDSIAVKDSFDEKMDVMFRFPGILGEVCGDFLRGDLSSFLAVMKRGKTWWLIYTAIMAMYAGYHVIFVSLEMNLNPILRRFWRFLTGQTIREKEIERSRFVENEKDDNLFDVSIYKQMKEGVDINKIEKDQTKIRMHVKSGDIRILPFPAFSTSLRDIEMEIDNLSYFDNYNADVIVIDYADIIRPDGRAERMDYRNQLDYIWKSLRGMAQKRKVHIVTASQAAKSGFSRDLSEEMVTEDIRKLAHVSKMIAINQNKFDREHHAVRIEQLAEREEGRNYKQAYVLQCLDIGNPHIDSKYADNVYRPKEDKKYSRKSGKDQE